MIAGSNASGNYYYEVSINGLSLDVCFDSTAGTCGDSDVTKPFHTIRGKFSVQ